MGHGNSSSPSCSSGRRRRFPMHWGHQADLAMITCKEIATRSSSRLPPTWTNTLKEVSMSTATAAAVRADGVDETIEAYVATWNETDPNRRRAGIARAWAEKGSYRDPVMTSDGHAGVDAMLAGVQAKFPGFVLK